MNKVTHSVFSGCFDPDPKSCSIHKQNSGMVNTPPSGHRAGGENVVARNGKEVIVIIFMWYVIEGI